MRTAILQAGFRLFFYLAAVHALVTMTLWAAILHGRPLMETAISPADWHGHEMVFGYGMAVVAGFLLTAVRNWTKLPTCSGWKLAVLGGLWSAARLLMMLGVSGAVYCDLLFQLLLMVAVLRPIIKARQWRQSGVALILGALLVSNLLFYTGSTRLGNSAGLHLLVGLILLISSRILPFFTSKRVADYQPWRSVWLERLAAPVLLSYWICEVRMLTTPAAVAAGLLSVILAVILGGWHHRGIWRQPMLWVLHVAYAFIVLGFGLRAGMAIKPMMPGLGLHALALGGIGLMTVGMMTRVALGHTGRDVGNPPRLVPWIFAAITIAALTRVLGPLVAPDAYLTWIGLAQIFWGVAFLGFLAVFTVPLFCPRADNTPG
jgi:uncharacterized protein involved in response to NO